MTVNLHVKAQEMYQPLRQYCQSLVGEFDQIDDERKRTLEELAAYLAAKNALSQPVRATVICTHNSRRSHMGQLWLSAAAVYYGVGDFKTYSGGTEATAFNPRAVKALKDAGFEIRQEADTDNPHYVATLGPDQDEIVMFSKKYDHHDNPDKEFVAIMVCSDADEACPFVPGAEARYAIPYRDPKYADDTSDEEMAYAECCRQIAREMLYAVKFAKEASSKVSE